MEDITVVLGECRLSIEIDLVKVNSTEEANELGFLGSPTVRIDGLDVEIDVPDSGFGLGQRVYWVEDTPLARPPSEWIAAAVEAAME